jgi:hypothetical protein
VNKLKGVHQSLCMPTTTVRMRAKLSKTTSSRERTTKPEEETLHSKNHRRITLGSVRARLTVTKLPLTQQCAMLDRHLQNCAENTDLHIAVRSAKLLSLASHLYRLRFIWRWRGVGDWWWRRRKPVREITSSSFRVRLQIVDLVALGQNSRMSIDQLLHIGTSREHRMPAAACMWPR